MKTHFMLKYSLPLLNLWFYFCNIVAFWKYRQLVGYSRFNALHKTEIPWCCCLTEAWCAIVTCCKLLPQNFPRDVEENLEIDRKPRRRKYESQMIATEHSVWHPWFSCAVKYVTLAHVAPYSSLLHLLEGELLHCCASSYDARSVTLFVEGWMFTATVLRW
jgi:hypothetical protein